MSNKDAAGGAGACSANAAGGDDALADAFDRVAASIFSLLAMPDMMGISV